MNLGDALRKHHGMGPGFHLLRHLLSLIILADHVRITLFKVPGDSTRALAMLADPQSHVTGHDIFLNALRPFLYALLGMFFALSGFLVTASAIRNSNIRSYFANRALRIIPALCVETTLCAIVMGPIVTNLPLSQYFTDYHFYRYFGNILGQVTFLLPGVFTTNPLPQVVNVNLRTLPAEFWCYFLMMIAMVTGLTMRRRLMSACIVVGMFALMLVNHFDPTLIPVRDVLANHFTNGMIVVMFIFGALIYVNADYIPFHPIALAFACIGYYVLMVFNVLDVIAALLLAYITAYIGMVSFRWFDRLVKIDVSYGIYLYGFPITQASIYFLLPHMHGLNKPERFCVIFGIAFSLTILFASQSWRFIEKPALTLRKYFKAAPKAGEPPTTELTSPLAAAIGDDEVSATP